MLYLTIIPHAFHLLEIDHFYQVLSALSQLQSILFIKLTILNKSQDSI